MRMMGYGDGLGFGFGGLLALLGWILLVVGLVLLIAWAIGKLGSGVAADSAAAPPSPAVDALEVLRHRFARGEITKDEYLAAKLTLEDKG
jgi:putative membrane protein